jgi:hypothetical protein
MSVWKPVRETVSPVTELPLPLHAKYIDST